jgi:RimJ/RimL family protein N-acetyltransferase
VRRYTDADLWLMRELNTDEVWAYLGGAESEEKMLARHRRFLAGAPGGTQMFVIEAAGTAVGNVGYWQTGHGDEVVYEMGWMVLPRFWGQGFASRGTVAAIEVLRQEAVRDAIHAFPPVDNPASNGVCRRAGFRLVGEIEGEYPKGRIMRVNDWRLDLR